MFDGAESADDDELISGANLYQAALRGCEKTGVMNIVLLMQSYSVHSTHHSFFYCWMWQLDEDDVPAITDDDSFYAYPEIMEDYQMKITVSGQVEIAKECGV